MYSNNNDIIYEILTELQLPDEIILDEGFMDSVKKLTNNIMAGALFACNSNAYQSFCNNLLKMCTYPIGNATPLDIAQMLLKELTKFLIVLTKELAEAKIDNLKQRNQSELTDKEKNVLRRANDLIKLKGKVQDKINELKNKTSVFKGNNGMTNIQNAVKMAADVVM